MVCQPAVSVCFLSMDSPSDPSHLLYLLWWG
ncbi:rCG44317, partial [Rattus norvegicus]